MFSVTDFCGLKGQISRCYWETPSFGLGLFRMEHLDLSRCETHLKILHVNIDTFWIKYSEYGPWCLGSRLICTLEYTLNLMYNVWEKKACFDIKWWNAISLFVPEKNNYDLPCQFVCATTISLIPAFFFSIKQPSPPSSLLPPVLSSFHHFFLFFSKYLATLSFSLANLVCVDGVVWLGGGEGLLIRTL